MEMGKRIRLNLKGEKDPPMIEMEMGFSWVTYRPEAQQRGFPTHGKTGQNLQHKAIHRFYLPIMNKTAV